LIDMDQRPDLVGECGKPPSHNLRESRLQLNAMSRTLTRSGLEGMFLTDPAYGANLQDCVAFLRLMDPPAQPPSRRSFTVRLRFAETAPDAARGRRVFDMLLQGQPVLRDLGVLAAAGGPNRALVREFQGVTADRRLELELVPKTPAAAAAAEPLLCALEVAAETPEYSARRGESVQDTGTERGQEDGELTAPQRRNLLARLSWPKMGRRRAVGAAAARSALGGNGIGFEEARACSDLEWP
jgi:hypothetical protein